jgi:hypothetical protein
LPSQTSNGSKAGCRVLPSRRASAHHARACAARSTRRAPRIGPGIRRRRTYRSRAKRILWLVSLIAVPIMILLRLPRNAVASCSKGVAALVAGPDMPDATRSIEAGCSWRHQHIAALRTGGYREMAGCCGVDRHGNPHGASLPMRIIRLTSIPGPQGRKARRSTSRAIHEGRVDSNLKAP